MNTMITPTDNRRISERHPWPHAPAHPNAIVLAPSPSIVLAETNGSLRDAVALAFADRGCRVHCAANGDHAWQLLREAPFGLLIAEIEMPGMTGLDLLRRMRAASLFQPAILMSWNMPWDDPLFRELISSGAAIEKPFKMDQLIAVMCALVVLRPETGLVKVNDASAPILAAADAWSETDNPPSGDPPRGGPRWAIQTVNPTTS